VRGYVIWILSTLFKKIKSGRTEGEVYMTCIQKRRFTIYNILVGTAEGKVLLGRSRRR
jgi:hypothetical protein